MEELLNISLFDSIRNEALQTEAIADEEIDVQVDCDKLCKQTGRPIEVASHKYQRYLVNLVTSINDSSSYVR